MEVIEGYDIIVDGVDNFPTRYLLNDASVRLKIPVVSAAILGFEGQLSIFAPYDGPCYRCLFPVPPPAELAPSCGANGVLGVLPGTMGLLQATEVVKLIIGAGHPAHRPPAHVRRARRGDHRAEGAPRPGVPDLLARARGDLRRGDGRLPRLRGVLRRRRLTAGPPFPVHENPEDSRTMATIRIPPVLRAAVGGEREVDAEGENVGDVLRALTEAHPDTSAQIFRARRASSTAT